ncbi:hypothetical protein OG824_31480 [Streptomyces prunicolor]|uniref:hypothetical protein n=1 Tax=Streptomyces prunicolor TaxID=67348 RepID=UPI00225AF89B|nr:hypothetical protein [Streptomyces prunicolor]MCX5239731.1 hypothetical protein [Streptomyces prunicolor]
MKLIELAVTTYTEYEAQAPVEAAEMFAQARVEFLALVRRSVGETLCADAEKLDWQYTPSEGLPEEVEQATALLEPGRTEYLRYRADHGKDIWALELVRPCDACCTCRIDVVHSLTHLGQLLAGDRETRR